MRDKVRAFIRDGGTARMLAILLAAAVLLGLIAAWLARGEFKGRYAIPAAGADNAQLSASASSAKKPAPPTAPTIRAAPAVVPAPPAAEPLDNESAASDEDDDQQRIAHAIDRAARRALDSGEPVRWHKAGETGYVVVSEPRDDGERICRNVSATIDTDDGRTRSSSHLWCTTPDDDWAPAD